MSDKQPSSVGKIHTWQGLQASGLFAVILACSAYIRATLVSEAPKAHLADFVDEAEKAGLKAVNVFGGKNTSTYILESTGTGVVTARLKRWRRKQA
jgi:hypothetical protein